MSSSVSALTLENVIYDKKGFIAYVTLNRPKVMNALNKATINELRAAFEDARDDSAVRGVILTGLRRKSICCRRRHRGGCQQHSCRSRRGDSPGTGIDRSHRESWQAGHRRSEWFCPGRWMRTGDVLQHQDRG